MDYKNFIMEYFNNAEDGLHIQKIQKPVEAKNFHTHEYFQIYYIKKGSLIHYVEGSSAKLVAGDMFIVPPNAKHKIEEREESTFYSLSFMLNSVGKIDNSKTFATEFLNELNTNRKIRAKISFPGDEVLKVENIIEEIYREFQNKKIGHQDIIKHYILVLVSIFARTYFENTSDIIATNFEDTKKFILYCVEYIEKHYYRNITLENVVKLSAMSKSSFCKAFYEVTGYSFNKYLNLCRIRKSTEYIKNGYKITAIYGLLGYNSFTAFYRNFKSIMGISPAMYKNADDRRLDELPKT